MIKTVCSILVCLFLSGTAEAQGLIDSMFEDVEFKEANVKDENNVFFTSEKIDFIKVKSSVTDSVKFAIVVYKPEKPSRIILLSHGWHQSVKPPTPDSENPYPDFLTIQVDMRGRKYSNGKPDCNGYELYDFYDAYKYAVANYTEYISDTNQVYYTGGSGGGGNGYALLGKFPDFFCNASIACGMSDYNKWYYQDKKGEFRDEMLPWIGFTPNENAEAYQSRSGITTVSNILTPVYIVHGETDIRVPVSHAREFVQKANQLGKEVHYLELKGVGTRKHWGNITDLQIKDKEDFRLSGLEYRNPAKLPEKGTLIVAGFVVTKHFSVFMDSINSVGKIRYNLRKKQIEFLKGTGQINWR